MAKATGSSPSCQNSIHATPDDDPPGDHLLANGHERPVPAAADSADGRADEVCAAASADELGDESGDDESETFGDAGGPVIASDDPLQMYLTPNR